MPRAHARGDNQVSDRLKNAVRHKLDNISKIINWTSEMYERGLMPPDVARACHEYFSSEDEDAIAEAEAADNAAHAR